jgi:hypothetical protein
MDTNISTYKSELDTICRDVETAINKVEKNLSAADVNDQFRQLKSLIRDAHVPLKKLREEILTLRLKARLETAGADPMLLNSIIFHEADYKRYDADILRVKHRLNSLDQQKDDVQFPGAIRLRPNSLELKPIFQYQEVKKAATILRLLGDQYVRKRIVPKFSEDSYDMMDVTQFPYQMSRFNALENCKNPNIHGARPSRLSDLRVVVDPVERQNEELAWQIKILSRGAEACK